ncbi:hypothetical protein c7_L692 [Megavirus courdo7]|uniref:Uncharacterized protein n=1 Tax=Megavirus courdo7 TaxID=1128135 RepID=H2EBI2_9VIRU|nr:hypothetical protein c7_L692 [Megavirus courdo7]
MKYFIYNGIGNYMLIIICQ